MWTKETAEAELETMGSFEEQLGRIMYVGALEYERPSRRPLLNLMCLHPCTSVRPSLCGCVFHLTLSYPVKFLSAGTMYAACIYIEGPWLCG